MSKIFDELRCYHCNKKLSKKQTLFDTAWSGIYWCGEDECAVSILINQCEEFDANDPCNHED